MRAPFRRLSRRISSLHQMMGAQAFRSILGMNLQLEVGPLSKVNTPETVLVIAPHPDDEVFGCGGCVALHNQRGDQVHVWYLSDGERGTQTGELSSELAAQRLHEAEAGLNALGGGTIHSFHLPDSNINARSENVDLFTPLLEKLRPDRIYIPWMFDAHDDHQGSYFLLVRSLRRLASYNPLVCQYEVWSPLNPNQIIPIDSVRTQKEAAIAAHSSQINTRQYTAGILGLNAYRALQGNNGALAEALLVLPAHQLKQLMSSFSGRKGTQATAPKSVEK